MRRPLVAATAVLALVMLVPLASAPGPETGGSSACVPDVDARTNGDGSITVSWTPVEGASGYVVLRSEPDGEELAPLARLGADATEHRDGTARTGATYRYVVHAAGAGAIDACEIATASSISYRAGFFTAVTVIAAALGAYVVVRSSSA